MSRSRAPVVQKEGIAEVLDRLAGVLRNRKDPQAERAADRDAAAPIARGAQAAPEQHNPPAKRNRSIGALLVDSGRLSPTDTEAVLRLARDEHLRFGDAAVRLGLVTRADVQHALARQFDYPYLAPGDDTLSPEVIAAYAPFSPAVQALRDLRTQLMLRWTDAEPPRKTLALVSPGRGDGRSYLAANLAVVFSQLGERTLLIDADLRNPRQHEIFRIPGRLGLSALLARRGDENVIHRIGGLLGLSVLPAGAAPPNPLELLSRSGFGALLSGLSAQYDVIVLDTPASELGTDFQSVAAAAGGALLITRRNVTRTADAQALSDSVAAAAVVVGAVINDH
ncbi:MAG: chain length determinant protein tyrosine kinase EpsG [Burkholderiales bacterium]|nr:chain length determinant protein tyrosine kinase EpsG [Burkholderiales bacterium]